MINSEKIKKDWIEYYEYLLQTYENSKEVMEIPFGMILYYDSLNINEQLVINQILENWLMSKDSEDRHMARYLIRGRSQHICDLIPTIKKSIVQLKTLPQDVHLKYEIETLQELLEELKNGINLL